MPKFGEHSKNELTTICFELQDVLTTAIEYFDFSIVKGYRPRVEQHEAFINGKSEVDWPNSKHNSYPSLAVDVAPYVNGIKWDDTEGFTLLAGVLKGIAITKGYRVRVGADWDGDLFIKEHSFIDRPHIEYIGRL